jgi:hypothetical protein
VCRIRKTERKAKAEQRAGQPIRIASHLLCKENIMWSLLEGGLSEVINGGSRGPVTPTYFNNNGI